MLLGQYQPAIVLYTAAGMHWSDSVGRYEDANRDRCLIMSIVSALATIPVDPVTPMPVIP